MSAVFNLNHEKLAADPRFAAIAGELSGQSQIESRASLNRYCREACQLWNEHFGGGIGKTSALFSALLDRVDKGGGGVIKTPWGGEVIELHEHPGVEKYLVIRKSGYLALETHEQKDERLEVTVPARRRSTAHGRGARAGRSVPFRARHGALHHRDGELARIRAIRRSQGHGPLPRVYL